ncbi:GATA zinc finger domain-containing protein 4-like [Diorhabda carinulata]|uniref:GATA zinc finger domain-containing protein 4-like n=1 Tax=Diorhabda carinulata TaxID=1163345 RepID=UPI0025A17902|nr:GATA zinc finger domain-containing protein 4-like [Diorhabda carinulata]
MNSEVTINELTRALNNLLLETTTDSNPTNSSSTVNNQIDMAVQPLKWEYSNCIPDFDGNPNDLNRFISVSESLISNFIDRTNPNNYQNVYLLNSIIAKIKGKAKTVINIQTCNTWNELKDVLMRNFSDQRDEVCFNRDLVMLRQSSNESPQSFYDKCLHILNLLCSYVNLHESTEEGKHLKRQIYQNLTLKTFLSGLKEPIGTTIRCMKPTSLSEAMQFVLQEENVHYLQNPSRNNHRTQPFKNNSRPNRNFHSLSSSSQTFNSQTPNNLCARQHNFPSQPIPINPRTTYQNFPRASQVFNRPNQNVNVFRPNPNANFHKPIPMSISTRATASNTQNQPIYKRPPPSTNNFRQSKKPNYTSEELYNVDIQENYDPENREYLNNNYDDSDHTTDQLNLNNSNSNNDDDRVDRNENFRLDNLKILQAKLNFQEGFLIIPSSKIKLHYHEVNVDLNLVTVSPRTQQVVKIKTSVTHGDIIVPYPNVYNCEIPQCLTTARNGYALTTILNKSDSTVSLDFSEPFQVESFDENELQNVDLNNIDSHNTLLDLNKIRTDHMNKEEKKKILKLCQEYSDIFYKEGEPLSFTNKINHNIRTTDEIPIYSKTYQYPFIHKQEVAN